MIPKSSRKLLLLGLHQEGLQSYTPEPLIKWHALHRSRQLDVSIISLEVDTCFSMFSYKYVTKHALCCTNFRTAVLHDNMHNNMLDNMHSAT